MKMKDLMACKADVGTALEFPGMMLWVHGGVTIGPNFDLVGKAVELVRV